MKHRDVAVILATGGMGLVRAAYSSGKPAYGVGPGNAPCYVERSADLSEGGVSDIMTGKTFDNGVLCSSPNSVVVDESVSEEVRREFQALGRVLHEPGGDGGAGQGPRDAAAPPQPSAGREVGAVHRQAGRHHGPGGDPRPDRAARRGLGATIPSRLRSSRRSCPGTSSRTGGRGASAVSRSCGTAAWATPCRSTPGIEDVILQFGLKKPAFRICVNTPTTHGSIGLTTGLDPAMTLGCGGWGGNITSDNITPKHLLNIKRLAYEMRPATVAAADASRRTPAPTAEGHVAGGGVIRPAVNWTLPRAPSRPVAGGIPVETLASRIDQFLTSRGYSPPERAGRQNQCRTVQKCPTLLPISSAKTTSARRSRQAGSWSSARRPSLPPPLGTSGSPKRCSCKAVGRADCFGGNRPISTVRTKLQLLSPARLIVDPLLEYRRCRDRATA